MSFKLTDFFSLYNLWFFSLCLHSTIRGFDSPEFSTIVILTLNIEIKAKHWIFIDVNPEFQFLINKAKDCQFGFEIYFRFNFEQDLIDKV
jgi:hypothetical protein